MSQNLFSFVSLKLLGLQKKLSKDEQSITDPLTSEIMTQNTEKLSIYLLELLTQIFSDNLIFNLFI